MEVFEIDTETDFFKERWTGAAGTVAQAKSWCQDVVQEHVNGADVRLRWRPDTYLDDETGEFEPLDGFWFADFMI